MHLIPIPTDCLAPSQWRARKRWKRWL